MTEPGADRPVTTALSQRHIMVVLTESHPGRDREFNEWYDREHLADVLRTHGFTTARRFRLADVGGLGRTRQRYLAIYEIEGDVQAAYDNLVAGRPDRHITDAMDTSATEAFAFTQIAESTPGE